MIVRAGTPDPELKYLRRWAADAGFDVHFGAGLSAGVMLRDGDARLTPESLAEADVLLIDERAWLTLDADEKIALDAALANGLGIVLRDLGPAGRVGRNGVGELWLPRGECGSAAHGDARSCASRCSGARHSRRRRCR